MKTLLICLSNVALLACSAFAGAPEPATDLYKTLSAASKEQKMAFILLGRPTCSNCNATKAMIREAKIPVTASEFVMADLNVDDPRVNGAFMQKYGKEKFGDMLPFVVVTDSHGKALASSGGYKNAAQWNTLLSAAKAKAKASATAAPGAKSDWPFGTPAK